MQKALYLYIECKKLMWCKGGIRGFYPLGAGSIPAVST
jgi:hypothetical protein